MRIFLICYQLFLIYFSQCLFAQEIDSLYTDDKLENFIENNTEEELETFADILDELRNSPLNLNEVTYSDLMQIPILSSIEAAAIIDYRNKYGRFFSIYELKNIPTIQLDKAVVLTSFFYVEQMETEATFFDSHFDGIKFELRSRMINDLQSRSAFSSGKYQGSSFKQYNRIKVTSNNLFFSLLTEKDAGEKNLADHYKYYVGLKNIWHIKKLIIGSFLFEHGHGLALWSPYSSSKGAEIIQPLFNTSNSVKEFSGSLESYYFNGIASNFEINNFNATLFYSKNFFDASIDSTTETVKSIRGDGYHRTDSELDSKNNLSANAIGLQFGYSFGSMLKINLLHFNTTFNRSFLPENNYGVSGREFSVSSVAYESRYNNIYLSGEIANANNASALINSLAFQENRKFGLIISYRYYPINYRSLYANGFSESSTTNESGLYLGLTSVNNFGSFKFYADIYSTLNAASIGGLPLNGNDFLFDWQKNFGKDLELSIRYKSKTEEEKVNIENSISSSEVIKNRLRAEIKYGFDKIKFRNRIESVDVKGSSIQNEFGFLLFHDTKLFIALDVLLHARIIFFNTDTYASAIYEFENDVPGVLINLPMYGEGMRWYLVGKVLTLNPFIISFKYSETIKPLAKNLSSGDSEIRGNIDNRFSLLVEVKF